MLKLAYRALGNLFQRGLKNREYKVLMPLTYLACLVVGTIVSLLYFKFPNLVLCLPVLGQPVCAPTGIYIGLLVSLPGYVLASKVFALLPEIHWILSFIVVVALSFGSYFLLGKFIDRYKPNSSESKVSALVLIFFAALLLVFLILRSLVP